jgi:lipopolysaccharide export system protein LptA
MIFFRLCAVLALILLCGGTAAKAQSQALLESLTSNLNIEGFETTYDPETGLATATGDVHITYGDVEIRCGTASYNANTGEVIARDNVVVWKAGVTYKGESILYNANTGELSGDAIRSSMPLEPGTFFYKTDNFSTETKTIERVDGENAFFTTHDLKNPNFRLRARQLTIYPGDRVVMRNVTVLAGNTPVFYLPYLSQSLEDEVGYRFSPGYTSGWGAFLLNQYSVIHGDHTLATYRLDYRTRRGVGGGVDFLSMRHKDNQNNFGRLKLYYLHDIDPTINRTGSTRVPVDEDRYRINFQHRIYLPGPEKSTWYLDFDINKISDAHFYEDFFFNDFRETPEPDNQVSLVHVDPAYTATLMTRFQFNDFYRVGERLPELSVDFTRRPLWNTGIFHQGSMSAGVYNELFSDAEQDSIFFTNRLLGAFDAGAAGGAVTPFFEAYAQRALNLGTTAPSALQYGALAARIRANRMFPFEPGFTRFHTYQEFLYPKTLFGWLNVVPRIGGGVTHYEDVDGSPTGIRDHTKPIFHAGVDVSFKLTKSWTDLQKPSWGLDGLRHVLQPYINYSYLDADKPVGFPSIDRLSPSTRPRSIDVPMFTAIDDLQSWNITRVGMRNFLQTRRDYTSYSNGTFLSATPEDPQTYTWAGLNTYVDVFINDPEFNRNISNLYNELFFRPVPWMNFWLDWQLPLDSGPGTFSELNQGITFMPDPNLHLTLGHQYVSDSPYFRDSNIIFSRVYARLNHNWGFAMNHIFEMDDGTMEFQSYSITRDLSSWIASLGVMFRENRGGPNDNGIILSLTLKDFPQVNIPLDIDPNPSGRGGNQ